MTVSFFVFLHEPFTIIGTKYIFSRFSKNSETNAPQFRENPEKLHDSVQSVWKGLHNDDTHVHIHTMLI